MRDRKATLNLTAAFSSVDPGKTSTPVRSLPPAESGVMRPLCVFTVPADGPGLSYSVFLAATTPFLGPLRVLAFVWVLCPRTGRFFLWRTPL